MSKSPKTRKTAPQPRAAKDAPARKATKAARRTATSSKAAAKSSRRTDRTRRAPQSDAAKNRTKQAVLIALLSRSEGASVSELAAKAGWQHHSVRGFLSGTAKKKLGLSLTSETLAGRGRVYRIAKRP
jgi:Protein of unknown function (DUF3489)